MSEPAHVELDLLRSFSPLDGLKNENLRALARKTVVRELASGRLLFREGDREKRTYYLVSGSVDLLGVGHVVATVKGRTPDAHHPLAPLLPRRCTARVALRIEHIARVLGHAGRLENSIETAVQLHFSATAHRTNQIMRILTVITAVFAPLTLVAGLWGMNFESIPGAKHPHGFLLMIATMTVLAVMLLVLLWVRRVLTDRPTEVSRWWRRRMRRPDPGRPISAP